VYIIFNPRLSGLISIRLTLTDNSAKLESVRSSHHCTLLILGYRLLKYVIGQKCVDWLTTPPVNIFCEFSREIKVQVKSSGNHQTSDDNRIYQFAGGIFDQKPA